MKDLFPYYSIGHFINEPDNPTEFEVTLFQEMEEPEVEDPHKHTFYEILWVEEGFTRQVIDYMEFELSPHTLFFISPGQLHHFEEWHDLKGGTIFFTEDFYRLGTHGQNQLFELSFLDNLYGDPSLQLQAEEFENIQGIIYQLIAEKHRPDYSPAIAQSLLHLLLLQIQRCVDSRSESVLSKKYLVLFKKFKQLLEQHFTKGLKASDYARHLHITPHHLNYISKQVTGQTASSIIRSRSLLEAKRLLTFSDLTISEVAAQLRFFDLSYFGKVFRTETGCSPQQFRTQISEKYRNL
jgi:AraC family transcriptional activator of pobA